MTFGGVVDDVNAVVDDRRVVVELIVTDCNAVLRVSRRTSPLVHQLQVTHCFAVRLLLHTVPAVTHGRTFNKY